MSDDHVNKMLARGKSGPGICVTQCHCGSWDAVQAEAEETGGRGAETLSGSGTREITQSLLWAVYCGRLWKVYPKEKDNSSLGCVSAPSSAHQEHTHNSAGWGRSSWSSGEWATGRHRVTQPEGFRKDP